MLLDDVPVYIEGVVCPFWKVLVDIFTEESRTGWQSLTPHVVNVREPSADHLCWNGLLIEQLPEVSTQFHRYHRSQVYLMQ